MLTRSLLSSLAELPAPLLTVYLETNPGKADNQRHTPAYLTWLKTEAKAVARELPPAERSSFLEQVDRVENSLGDHSAKQRGLLILAGATVWQQIPLVAPVQNELRWGRPALSQLVQLVEEHHPTCIVAVDRAGARFFRYSLGDLTEFAEQGFQIDSSQWKRKEHSHRAERGSRLPHGPQRDAFQQRVDAQYLRFCRELAEHTKALCTKERLFSIFLVGSMRLIEPVGTHLMPTFRDHLALIDEDLARVSPSDLERHVGPKIAEWMNRSASARVAHLLDAERGTVVGIDETLAQIQNGTVRTVLLAHGLDATLQRCVQCGLTNRSADPRCPSCGGAWQEISLREALPQLVRATEAELEIVTGEAAKRLLESGGLGGWLRHPDQAYEIPSTSPRL